MSMEFIGTLRKGKTPKSFSDHGVLGIFRTLWNQLWWRCRDSNPGHCGYEPHALTD
jgi:hypothetical protein